MCNAEEQGYSKQKQILHVFRLPALFGDSDVVDQLAQRLATLNSTGGHDSPFGTLQPHPESELLNFWLDAQAMHYCGSNHASCNSMWTIMQPVFMLLLAIYHRETLPKDSRGYI